MVFLETLDLEGFLLICAQSLSLVQLFATL